MKRRAAPQRIEPGKLGRAVLHAGGQQHSPRALARAVGEFEDESAIQPFAGHNLAGA
jgi:hypothetical protein